MVLMASAVGDYSSFKTAAASRLQQFQDFQKLSKSAPVHGLDGERDGEGPFPLHRVRCLAARLFVDFHLEACHDCILPAAAALRGSQQGFALEGTKSFTLTSIGAISFRGWVRPDRCAPVFFLLFFSFFLARWVGLMGAAAACASVTEGATSAHLLAAATMQRHSPGTPTAGRRASRHWRSPASCPPAPPAPPAHCRTPSRTCE